MEKRFCKKCGIELPENWNHKLCEACREKKLNFVKKALLIAVTVGAGLLALWASSKSDDENSNDDHLENEYIDDYDLGNDYSDDDCVQIEEHVTKIYKPRNKVEMRAFNTGDWYTKTETDYVRSAYSVAKCSTFGRACRLTDTETGRVLLETDEGEGMAELASEYRKYY